MRILLVNWARLPEGPLDGGGVNGYCRQLALSLTHLGHDVSYISSGVSYTGGVRDANGGGSAGESGGGAHGLGPCEVRRLSDHAGIRIFEVVNSPVIAPGPCQARDPLAEISSPVLEAEFARFVKLLDPDVVHFHNAEGFSAGCIAAARDQRGRRIFFSLHNYHTVCPQVYLMQRGRVPCHTFDHGRACVGCADVCDPGEERRRRAGAKEVIVVVATPPRRGLAALFDRNPTHPTSPTPPTPSTHSFPADPLPGRGVRTEVEARALDAAIASKPATSEEPNAREHAPLANLALPDPSDPRHETDYAKRRRAFVAALSSCDGVLAVSDFVRDKFIALGVDPRVMQTLHIGTRMNDLAASRPVPGIITPTPCSPSTPLRLIFIGYHNFFKGLHCLATALEGMTPAHLLQIDLFISAKAVEPMKPRLASLRPRLARLAVEEGYRYEEIPDLCRDRDVGIVPSVWWDNGPQTVLEFLACGLPVIGANLGGIPDFVRHEHNGLLFTGNHPADLRASLIRLLEEPNLLESLRRNVQAPKGMAEHAGEMARLYATPNPHARP